MLNTKSSNKYVAVINRNTGEFIYESVSLKENDVLPHKKLTGTCREIL